MTIFARSLSLSIDRRSPAARRLALAATLVASIWAGLMLAAAPAGAVVETVSGTTVGSQPRSEEVLDGNGELGAQFANAGGNPVVHTNNTYAIYWDPTDRYHGDWQGVIDGFLRAVGTDSGSLGNVFAVDTQYRDKTNQGASYQSTFRGAYTDTNLYPGAGCKDPNPMQPGDKITCLTDEQIREQLATFISQHGLQKGMGTIFYLLTPPGVTVCIDGGPSASHCSSNSASPKGFCSYHSAVSPTNPATGDANTILYAAIPWTAGGLGDGQLAPADQTAAVGCQDGGFDPTSKPIEKKEKKKQKTKQEVEEFEAKTPEEQEKQVVAEALEGPHQQEPNQAGGRSPDGFFDTGLADIIVNQVAVEQQNTVTDPLLNAWQDPETTRPPTSAATSLRAERWAAA